MAKKRGPLEQFSTRVSAWTASSMSFVVALSLVLLWLVSGPVFGWSNTWQLVINTCTTIVTFLMVFLIQRAQAKESRAIHLKLNELLAATHGASNRLLNLEDHSEGEMRTLHRHFSELARLARADAEITESHSVEEAQARHASKKRRSGTA
jgi:low affinity Fe/Cu permease